MARKQQLSDDEIHHDIAHAFSVDAEGCFSVHGTGEEVMAALLTYSIKVVWLDFSDSKLGVDVFCYAVQRKGVERVRLDLNLEEIPDHPLQQMAAALAHPACLVWDLELCLQYSRHRALWMVPLVSKALQRQGSTLLKLKMQVCKRDQILDRALRSPNCRLQHLSLYRSPLLPQLQHTSITSIHLPAKHLSDEMLVSTLTCLSVERDLDLPNPDTGALLLRTLESGKCTLRHAHGFEVTSEGSQRRIVDWLEANPGGSRVEVLEFHRWESDTLKEYCAKILERNKRYRDRGLLDEDQVEVSTAKLFMCGHTGVGKTTITRNLVRTLVPLGLPACLQRHRSTYGIDVRPLKYRNGQKLLVCDLAGQHEYHSFHHYFVRGSDKDVFAIVCRGPSSDGHQHFKDELHYWLRFIAAHRGVSSDKLPRVIIVLNYFGDSDRGVQAEDRCKALVDSYRGVIHFAGVVGLVATRYSDVQAFKKMLGTALANLLEALHPKMPKICHKLLEAKRRILRKPSGAQSYAAELATLKEAAALKGYGDAVIQVCFLHLHDIGEVVFFEKQQGLSTEEQGEQLVILDFQWFVREVIGIFVPRLDRPGETTWTRAKPPSSMTVEAANVKLDRITPDGKHTKYLMDVLQRLGVLIIDEENVKVLPLLTQEFKAWPSDQLQGERSYWGRRFSCRNEEVTLMPSGIFAMLQVRLGDIFCHKIKVGNGWIHTVRNFVEVVVKIGGKTGDWHDRHWINVLLRFPENRINDASEILTQVKDTIVDICSAIHWGCPALELDEWVINPTVVMVIEEVDKSEERDTMESLIEEAIKEGSLGYGHTWNPSLECTPLKTLLTPDEQRSCMEKYLEPHLLKIVALDNLQHEVEDHMHLIKVTQDEGSGYSAVEPTTFATKSEEVNFKLLKKIVRMVSENNRISKEILHEVKDVKKLIEMKSNQILSLLLLNVDTGFPKYPYITRSDNIFQTFFSEQVAGSRWRINFLCEYGTCHEVEGQKGIWHTEMPNWLRKSAPVLIPALRLLFFAGKVATTAALGPNVLPQGDPFVKRLQSAAVEHVLHNLFGSIDSSLTALHLTGHQGIREEELREFCSKLLEGKNIEEELGLHKVVAGNSTKWVCKAHKVGRNT